AGNWACAIAGIVAANCARQAHLDSTVRMWVFDEVVDGKKLTDWMNLEHENVKYLPGVKLPENIVAIADVGEACQDADVLIFCLPHQFLDRVCQGVKGRASPDAIAVSLIKAVEFDESGVVLISEMIKKMLGGMDVSVLMGANLAGEVAAGSFCETTVGYRVRRNGLLVRDIFDDPLFRVGMVNDVDGVEVCGALKNVVALGAGFCDGMGLGQNSKAAMVRIGLMEMKKFIQERFPGVKDETFFESCGVADLLVTCYGGRNRRCAEEFVRSGGTKSWEDIEAELLNGQKLQGTLTAKEVYKILEKEKALDEFPLFASIHQVSINPNKP
ncbi:glycerol-3-phosphate dehydrogenase 1-like protein-like protein, partial [Baffinella frigidus]